MQHSSRIGSLQAGRRSACVPSTPAPPPTRISRCNAVYQPPSSATAASELELLKQSSVVVPDSNESLAAAATPGGKQLFGARAATVSAATIAGIVAAGALGLKPYQVGRHRRGAVGPRARPHQVLTHATHNNLPGAQNAITAAMTYDRCKALPTEAERGHCKLDKATVNVGTLFSKVRRFATRCSSSKESGAHNDASLNCICMLCPAGGCRRSRGACALRWIPLNTATLVSVSSWHSCREFARVAGGGTAPLPAALRTMLKHGVCPMLCRCHGCQGSVPCGNVQGERSGAGQAYLPSACRKCRLCCLSELGRPLRC